MPELKTHHRAIIANVRQESGLSQAELGRRSDCTSQAVNRIESGGLNPSDELLERLCDALGLQLSVVPAKVTIKRKVKS